MQLPVVLAIFRQYPRFHAIHILVGNVCRLHYFLYCLAELPAFIKIRNRDMTAQESIPLAKLTEKELIEPFSVCLRNGVRELAAEFLDDESSASAGYIDVFSYQIAVDAGNEIIEIEIDILHAIVELGSIIIAQPLGIQALLQIAFRSNERSA